VGRNSNLFKESKPTPLQLHTLAECTVFCGQRKAFIATLDANLFCPSMAIVNFSAARWPEHRLSLFELQGTMGLT
jgi:hypothetical protein